MHPVRKLVIVVVFFALLLLPFVGIGCGGIPDCHTPESARIHNAICRGE